MFRCLLRLLLVLAPLCFTTIAAAHRATLGPRPLFGWAGLPSGCEPTTASGRWADRNLHSIYRLLAFSSALRRTMSVKTGQAHPA